MQGKQRVIDAFNAAANELAQLTNISFIRACTKIGV